MILYAIVWYGVLCYDILGNISPFTELFKFLCVLSVIYTIFKLTQIILKFHKIGE